MVFKVENLHDTWFKEIDLKRIGISGTRIPEDDAKGHWKCAVDRESCMLLTQLISSLGEMRDSRYLYVLAIKNDVILIECDGDYSSIHSIGDYAKYNESEIKEIANAAARVLYTNGLLIFPEKKPHTNQRIPKSHTLYSKIRNWIKLIK